MAITTQDVKLFKSERIDDTPEGGGRMTGNEVVDNELNNLFDDTSRLDRVYGRVSLRKCFGAVSTTNRDKFLGVHAIVTDPPDDGNVSVTILKLDDHDDEREQAKDYVESYLVAGVATPLTLFDSQPQGARSIVAYVDSKDTFSPPAPADVIVLSVESVGHPNNGFQQYVRIDTVSAYTLVIGQRRKIVYTFEITSPLEITFPGADILEFPGIAQRPTRIRDTDLNANIRYYGVVPLAVEAEPGDSVLEVETILQPVVPASYSEAPVLDQQVGEAGTPLIAAGTLTYSATLSTDAAGLGSLRVPASIYPGSALITADNATNDYDASFTDDGDGNATRTGGGALTAAATCTADYVGGTLAFTGLRVSNSYTVTVIYDPAANFADVQHTAGTEITEANRGFNYAKIAIPKPAPGTTRVRYRALGRWYELRDNGGGQLIGDGGTGAGTVNYLTGTINVTTAYSPDIGSYVLFGWGTEAHFAQVSTAADLLIGAHRIVSEQPIKPASLFAAWTVSGTDYELADDGEGRLTGDATGRVNYATGEILAVLNPTPAAGTVFTLDYIKLGSFGLYTPDPQPTPDGGGDISITIPGGTLEAGSIEFTVETLSAAGKPRTLYYRDNGAGDIRDRFGTTVRGSVNYSTGAATLAGDRTLFDYTYNAGTGQWDGADTLFEFVSVQVRFKAAEAGVAQEDLITPTELRTTFSQGAIGEFVPNALVFTLNGRAYFENGGLLYYLVGLVPTAAGVVDLLNGMATITSWVAGARTAALNALLTRYGNWPLSSVIWSTPGDPIRIGSFQVTNGAQTAISDNAGVLTGAAQITGSIDYETGVYQVTFSPAVQPQAARFNAVILTFLPLDPVILGLDPVRLPLSGTVPVIAQGDTLVIHNTLTTALPNPVVAGNTYGVGRTDLSYIVLYDQLGAKIPTDRYTVDLELGEVTFENPLDLSGYTQPLLAEQRIEDMLFCLDAQLNGDVNIVPGGLTHTYPVPGSFVSSAKLVGDLQARATEPFDQQAWTGVWSDTVIGSDATGEYNDLVYPIETTNAGTVKERWRIEFTGATTFRLIGEKFGQVDGATGNVGTDFTPINSLTGEPFFTLRAAGWGGGWSPGNQLRFNTFACSAPLWLLRCTLQGPELEPDDSVRLQFRGDSQ